MALTKDQILGALPKLSHEDLSAVHAITGQLLGPHSGLTAQGSGRAGLIFSALVTGLGQMVTLSGYSPTATRQFEKKLPDLEAFLDKKIGLWKETKITQIAFLRMLFNLLSADLKNRGVTPTIGIMVVNMGRIPEVFEDAFPGYLEAGMAKVILKRFQHR